MRYGKHNGVKIHKHSWIFSDKQKKVYLGELVTADADVLSEGAAAAAGFATPPPVTGDVVTSALSTPPSASVKFRL